MLCMIQFNVHNDAIELVNLSMNEDPHIEYPHGLSFLDNYTIIVANRNGNGAGISILHLDEVSGMQIINSRMLLDQTHPSIYTPGTIKVRFIGPRFVEAFVCNNYANFISRHLLDRDDDWNVFYSEKLPFEFDVPDGIALSNNRDWIAISNHFAHQANVY